MKAEEMKRRYRGYRFEDLLEDSFFRESIRYPDEGSEQFWNELLESGYIDEPEFRHAKELLLELEANRILPKRITQRLPVLWQRIETSNRKKSRLLYLRPAMTAAAVAVLAVLTFVFLHNKPGQDEQIYSRSGILGVEKKELSKEILLVGGDSALTIPGDSAVIDHSRDEALVVNDQVIREKEQAADYNQLVVPYGKRSSLILADGTKIWVNAGTRVVYPVVFNEKFREIYVDGEVYAAIAPDKNKPFVLRTKEMDVRVLGTELNITAYETDSTRRVVLIEGSVEVISHGQQDNRTLTPSQMFYASNHESYVRTVDVDYYISWKEGRYLFKDERLSSILKRLSRYYDIKIAYEAGFPDVVCSGGLDLKDNVERVLEGVCESTPVSYEWKNNMYVFSINQ